MRSDGVQACHRTCLMLPLIVLCYKGSTRADDHLSSCNIGAGGLQPVTAWQHPRTGPQHYLLRLRHGTGAAASWQPLGAVFAGGLLLTAAEVSSLVLRLWQDADWSAHDCAALTPVAAAVYLL